MARNSISKNKAGQNPDEAEDRPADTLLRAWGKKMAQGRAAMIPVFVGGKWSIQIPRGNKRVLSVKF